MNAIIKRAHQIRKQAAEKFGGKSGQYDMKIACEMAKEQLSQAQAIEFFCWDYKEQKIQAPALPAKVVKRPDVINLENLSKEEVETALIETALIETQNKNLVKIINIENCEITSLPESLFEFGNLEGISFYGCPIKSVFQAKEIKSLEWISGIDIAYTEQWEMKEVHGIEIN